VCHVAGEDFLLGTNWDCAGGQRSRKEKEMSRSLLSVPD